MKSMRLNNPQDAQIKVKEHLQMYPALRAVTVCFSDLEGRLHMLDYDKEFLIKSSENLTFDGSSIRGFTNQNESDLRLHIDWAASYVFPDKHFPNKMLIFGEVCDKDNKPYEADIRSQLKLYLAELRKKELIVNVAAEIEGFLFNGERAEQLYHETGNFEFCTSGGYFNALPGSKLRSFIDEVAEVQRLCGFENEKDHPEVAPSQFEINWSYTEALAACDQIQLYKLICRQVAANNGCTASFLPKPVVGVNGSGMHTNISVSKGGKNLFFGGEENNLSRMAIDFINGVLNRAEELCLVMNPSVNSYRRLDPAYEAPNEIKSSAIDRGSMIRIPLGNEKSARVEVRTVSPDANPYMTLLTLLKAGLEVENPGHRPPGTLPCNIHEAMKYFEESKFIGDVLGNSVQQRYLRWKQESAFRCPQALGTSVKAAEIMFHHEVTNQMLWSQF